MGPGALFTRARDVLFLEHLVVCLEFVVYSAPASEGRPPLAWCVAASPESPRHHRRPPSTPRAVPAGPRHARHFLRSQGHSPWASCWRNHLKAGAHVPAMDYVTSSRARASLTTARALQQEYLPHCDNMSQLPLLRSL